MSVIQGWWGLLGDPTGRTKIDIASRAASVEVTHARDAVEVTAIADTSRVHEVGLRSDSVSVSGIMDTVIEPDLWSALGNDRALLLSPHANPLPASTNPAGLVIAFGNVSDVGSLVGGSIGDRRDFAFSMAGPRCAAGRDGAVLLHETVAADEIGALEFNMTSSQTDMTLEANSSTTITVGTKFIIDDEVVRVTALGASPNQQSRFTIVRAQDSTSAATHSSGTSVEIWSPVTSGTATLRDARADEVTVVPVWWTQDSSNPATSLKVQVRRFASGESFGTSGGVDVVAETELVAANKDFRWFTVDGAATSGDSRYACRIKVEGGSAKVGVAVGFLPLT